MEIAQQNCRLRTCDDENEKNEEQKSKHVIHLAWPDRIQDEKQLNENATEWQDTAHDDAWDWLSVDRLLRNLTWNLICAHRMF